MLSKNDYRIKVLNTINFANQCITTLFAYIRSEKDILKLVNTIIVNTKGEGQQASEDFWVKAEKALLHGTDCIYLVRSTGGGTEFFHAD